MSAVGMAAGALDGWVAVGRADDVPLLEGRSVQVGARRVAIFRVPEGWRAIEHACPHRGGPLADGIVAADCVTCPLHGRRFSLSTGARVDAPGAGVATFEVRERGGRLELRTTAHGTLDTAA